MTPPQTGRAAAAGGGRRGGPGAARAPRAAARWPAGFVVWSSNRNGTHDILRMELPAGEITRLTSDPHTETYPRVSPDGGTVVFSRSHVPWVSQRDPVPWDAWAVGAAGGEAHPIARGATSPSWSPDGAALYFQRNGGEFVERVLATGAERTLFRAGEGPVPAGAHLQSPDYDTGTTP